MTKKKLLRELEDRGFDFDTRALICDDVLDIINTEISKTIKPKYKIGDRLFAIWDDEIYYGEVKEISYKQYLIDLDWHKKLFDIHYVLEIDESGYCLSFREKDVFTSLGRAEAMLK